MRCECLGKLTDFILFLWFIVFAVAVPLFDAQAAFPDSYYPKQLVDLKLNYANEYGHYLVSEKPNFFVGLVWVELFLQWPLSIASLFGLISGKSWYRTTTLIFGVSWFTSLAAIRGLIPCARSCNQVASANKPHQDQFGSSGAANAAGRRTETLLLRKR